MGVVQLNRLQVRKGRTVRTQLKRMMEYANDPTKTDGGRLVSSFGCDPDFALSVFLLTRREYCNITGGICRNDKIAYEAVQSFSPGEITPEKANRVGYEFASRLTGGSFSFLVCTHTDKEHIHNHIIWNAVALECRYKYVFPTFSIKTVRNLSDQICAEHGLSVITDPRRYSLWYSEWQKARTGPSMRSRLRMAIDRALAKKPENTGELIALLREEGFEARTGRQLAFRPEGWTKYIHLTSLGRGYSDHDIISVMKGEKKHIPARKIMDIDRDRSDLVSELEAKLRIYTACRGGRPLPDDVMKRLTVTLDFLHSKGYTNMTDLSGVISEMTKKLVTAGANVRRVENELSDLRYLREQVVRYTETSDIWKAYRNSGYSGRFHKDHEGDIIIHKAAGEALKKLGIEKLPSIQNLNSDFERLLSEKESAYSEYRSMKAELKELTSIAADIDTFLSRSLPVRQKTEQHEL